MYELNEVYIVFIPSMSCTEGSFLSESSYAQEMITQKTCVCVTRTPVNFSKRLDCGNFLKSALCHLGAMIQ